jgi:hypothetical protein
VIHHRDFPGRRWLGIVLRTLHLVGVVLAGGGLLGASAFVVSGAALMLVSGIALFAIDLWHRPDLWKEVAGVFVFVKLAVVSAMPFVPDLAAALFWLVLVASSAVSHAPRVFRHRRLLR